MPSIVVPFRGSGAKQRLAAAGEEVRAAIALAMLGDVLAACATTAATVVVTDDPRARQEAKKFRATVVDDPGAGQGPAVAAAIREVGGSVLVVNADLPCIRPNDLRALLTATPSGGLALVAAEDGTTNALSLADGRLFAPLYGPDSAERFIAHATALRVKAVRASIPNLADDVDTLPDLYRVQYRAGLRTQAAIALLRETA